MKCKGFTNNGRPCQRPSIKALGGFCVIHFYKRMFGKVKRRKEIEAFK